MILVESKRDELLQPYLDALNSRLKKPINMGRFKSILLDNLSYHGYLRNLSLASNYYLSGAAKYYFNGDLTLNNDLALLHPYHLRDEFNAARAQGKRLPKNVKDEWNVDVCKRLDILIKILRDSYINSIGTTYEIPEDFGNLPLNTLLRKYNSKINAVIEKTTQKETEYNPIGKKYSYEILYTYNEARKYMEATNPGHWCIAGRESTFRDYQKEHNAHFIIFRKDNWENVKRNPNMAKWLNVNAPGELPKPQDDYGNSLICYFQSNDSWEPVAITSRYNHGDEDTGDVDADNAYTLEEFCRITKVTPKDLQTIYEIWKSNRGKFRSTTGVERKKNLLLQLKEYQMRINGGDKPDDIRYKCLFGNGENLRNGVFIGYLSSFDEDEDYKFVIDKGRIVFETIMTDLYYGDTVATDKDPSGKYPCKNCIVLSSGDGKFIIYNLRTHSVIKVDGIYVFRGITLFGGAGNSENLAFYELAVKRDVKVLISAGNNKPLMLPNGQYFYKYIISNSSYDYRYFREVKATTANKNDLIEIKYDENTTFFFDTGKMSFVDFKPTNDENGNVIYPHVNIRFMIPGFYSVIYTISPEPLTETYSDYIKEQIAYTQIFKNGELFYIGNSDKVYEASSINDKFIQFVPITLKDKNKGWRYMIYNTLTNEPFSVDGKPVVSFGVYCFPGNDGFIEMYVKRTQNSNESVIFTSNGEQVKNPISYPSPNTFYVYPYTFSNFFFYKTRDFNAMYGWKYETTVKYYKEKLIGKIKMGEDDLELGNEG